MDNIKNVYINVHVRTTNSTTYLVGHIWYYMYLHDYNYINCMLCAF